MAKDPKMPSARTAPVDDVPNQEPNWDGEAAAGEDIQRGMPARNIKTAVMGIVLVGVLAFLFWPRGPRVNRNLQDVEPTKQNIVEDLVRGVKPIQEEIKIEPVLPTPLAVKEQKSVDERELAALLASMSASDVTLGGQGRKPSQAMKAAEEIKGFISQQTARAEEVRRNGAALLAGGQGQGGAGADSPGERSQNPYESFLQENRSRGLGAAVALNDARKAATLYEGTIIRAVLTRSLKTDLPGTLTAKVSTDLYDSVSQKILLVPRGSEVSCGYQSNLRVGQELVLVGCTRLRFPNGKSFSLNSAVASDMQGASGMSADINNHFFKMFGNALIVGAASRLLPKTEQQVNVSTSDSGSDTGGVILGTALSKIIDATIARNVLIPPTGTVDIGTPFTLTLSRDVELEPYAFH